MIVGATKVAICNECVKLCVEILDEDVIKTKAEQFAKGNKDILNPVNIKDIAYELIRLSGLEPEKDISIEYIGSRPGEKLYEELLIGDDVVQSEHPRIMQAKENKLPLEEVMKCIKIIKSGRENQDETLVKELLLKYVDGYISETV